MAKGGRGCGYGMATEVTECNEVCYAHATVKKGTLAKILYVPSQQSWFGVKKNQYIHLPITKFFSVRRLPTSFQDH